MDYCYEGGLSTKAGKNLYPKMSTEGENSGTYGGEGAMKTTKGGPSVNSGGGGEGSFVTKSSYRAVGMEERVGSSMKIVNPDDLSSSA